MQRPTDGALAKKVATAVAFAVVTCVGAATTAAPVLRLIWVTCNLAGCGVALRRIAATGEEPQPVVHCEMVAVPQEALHDMPAAPGAERLARSASCEIVAVSG